MFQLKNNGWFVDAVSFDTLAATYGTPLYVYSAGQITENYHALNNALQQTGLRTHIHFAVKANYNLAVLRHLKNLGAGADVVSGGELQRALAAGMQPDQIIFSGVGKTDAELQLALANNIHQINLESAEELQRLIELARAMHKTMACAVRINPDVDAKTHAKVSTGKSENKFGVDLHTALKMFATAKNSPINLRGITSHIGSQLLDLAPYDAAFKVMAEFTRTLQGKGYRVDRVDIGGGIGVPYAPGDTAVDLQAFSVLVKRHFTGFQGEIYTEPGRYLVANAGVLLSRVVFIKRTVHKIFVVLDAAMNDLMRPALYDAYHPIYAAHADAGGAVMQCDIVGGVCETSDLFATNRMLPANLKVGDLMVIGAAGAYGATMAGTYNARDQIAEVMVHRQGHSLVRQRWPIADQLALETIPDFLT